MRKTSQDGGDATSITSGVENEIKKTAAGIVKMKRNSIKRKVQNFSNESDDGVGEPLLQKEKEKVESLSQSAKFLLSKTKTDNKNNKLDDKEKSFCEDKVKTSATPTIFGMGDSVANGLKDKCNGFGTSTIQNHMNTNVFANTDNIKHDIVPKTQILVEIDGTKPSSYNTGPLIFTTAKIHTDGTNKHMEPVQVTPVPILSTVEGSVIKTSSLGDVEHTKSKSNNIASGGIKKADIGLCTVFGNNFKGLPKATDCSTTVPISKTVTIDNAFEHTGTNSPALNKIYTTVCSSSNGMSQPLKQESNIQGPKISSEALKSELKSQQPVLYEPKRPSTSYENNIISTTLNVDVNKNFESNSSESKQPENYKLVLSGKDFSNQALQDTISAKINNSESKQMHRQKTMEEPKDILESIKTCSSEPTRTQTATSIFNVKVVAQDKPTNITNTFCKTVSAVSVAKPTTSTAIITAVSSSILNTKPSYVPASTTKYNRITLSTTQNSMPSVNIKSKGTGASSSNTVNVMTVASQIKSTTTSEQQKLIAVSGVPKKSTTQVGKKSALPVTSFKSADKTAEVSKTTSASHQKDNVKMKSSTNSAPSTKSPVQSQATEKTSSTFKPNISVTKSIDTPSVTTSSKFSTTNSKPITTASGTNVVKTDYSLKTKSPNNIISSTSHSANSKAVDTMPRVVSESNTPKTSSLHSFTPTSSKMPQSTVESRSTVTAGKSTSTLSKMTSSSSNPSTNVKTSKIANTSSSTKPNNTQMSSSVGVKSPTTTDSSAKQSVTHNQIQLERSETKKEKLK